MNNKFFLGLSAPLLLSMLLSTKSMAYDRHYQYDAMGNRLVVESSQSPSTIIDFESSNFAPLYWQHSGNANWHADASKSIDGLYSVRSGDVSQGQHSNLTTTVHANGQPVSFYLATEGLSGIDVVIFSIDGVVQQQWSGKQEFTYVEFPLSAGKHQLSWQYQTSSTQIVEVNGAWLDHLSIGMVHDSDNDSIADSWEYLHFDTLTHDHNQDSDSDGLSDINEYLAGSDPFARNIEGHDGEQTVYASETDEVISGQGGNDVINALGGNDIIIGGLGDDVLDGGSGDDIYQFNLGDGRDVIKVSEGNNSIHFGPSISPDMLSFSVVYSNSDNSYSLLVNVGYYGDQLLISNWLLQPHIMSFIFAGNITLSAADIKVMANIITGTSQIDSLEGSSKNDSLIGFEAADTLVSYQGNNMLFGGKGNDSLTIFKGDTIEYADYSNTLYGGKGDDRLEGYSGNDNYVFYKGDGKDVISDSGGFDSIRFAGELTSADIKVSRSANNLVFELIDDFGSLTGDSITVENGFSIDSNPNKIEQITLADNSIIDWHHIYQLGLTIEGTPQDDIFIGTEDKEIFIGKSGNDVYHFGFGSNQDVMDDLEGNDEIILGNDVSIENIQINVINSDIVISLVDEAFLETGDSLRIVNGVNRVTEPTIVFHNQRMDFSTFLSTSPTIIVGTITDDSLSGIGDTEYIFGSSGNDNLRANSSGDDQLYGGGGNDTLTGVHSKNNHLYGGDGNDTLTVNDTRSSSSSNIQHYTGGRGDDYLVSAISRTHYYYELGDGHDVIVNNGLESTFGPWPGPDKLIFGKNIKPNMVRFIRNPAGDIILQIVDSSDITNNGSIRLYKSYLPRTGRNAYDYRLEVIEFMSDPSGKTYLEKQFILDAAQFDSDNDGLSDEWEMQYFGALNHDMSLDLDKDGLSNIAEYQTRTNPNNADSDGDGMPDYWEVTSGMNPTVSDANQDANGDGTSNYIEYIISDNDYPVDRDSDGDGFTDIFEVNNGLNPFDVKDISIDSDNDGLPDDFEVYHSLDVNNANDVLTDKDLDGFNVWQEFHAHTSDNDAMELPKGTYLGFETNTLDTFYWNKESGSNWLIGNLVKYQGSYSLHSGILGTGEASKFETTINSTGEPISFHSSLTQMHGTGELEFYINDVLQPIQTGNGLYSYNVFPMAVGKQTLTWIVSNHSGSNIAWLDNIYIPALSDSDFDNVKDGWEYEHFDNLDHDMSLDSDIDGLTDKEEYLEGSNPSLNDTDGDNMADGWEKSQGLNLLVNDASGDVNGDGRINLVEYILDTPDYPIDIDSDGDGVPDVVEVQRGTNPTSSEGENNIIIGTPLVDQLVGSNQVDQILGLEGDDVIIGGLGNDELDGGLGKDTFQFSLGDGHDVIKDAGGIDIIAFDASITAEMLSFTQKAGSNLFTLTISINSSTDQIDIQNWKKNSFDKFVQIVFADGSTWSNSDIENKVVDIVPPVKKISVPKYISGQLWRGRYRFPIEMHYTGNTSIDYAGLVAPSKALGHVQRDDDGQFTIEDIGLGIHHFEIPAGSKVARFSLRDESIITDGSDLDLYVYQCKKGDCNKLVGKSLNINSNEDVILLNPEVANNQGEGDYYVVYVYGHSTGVTAGTDYSMSVWVANKVETTTSVLSSRRAVEGRNNNVSISTRGLEFDIPYMGAVTFYNDLGEAEGTTVLELHN